MKNENFVKIVVACDSFKGSLSSLEVGLAARKGIVAALPCAQVEIIPVADGGEGTVEAIVNDIGGRYVDCRVVGPLGKPVMARYGVSGNTSIIEMARASGLTLISPEEYNPWFTTSYGTGQMIKDAFSRGCRRFLVAIGGSATNDGGVGMLQALGFRFLDKDGCEIGRGGGELGRIHSIDASNVLLDLKNTEFIVACDVTNPLTGPNGASCVFGPQKGADADMVEQLDCNLQHYARVVGDFIGKDLSAIPGTGAAGGLGFAFVALLGAKLKPGIDMVLDSVKFDSRIKGAALIITGEGCLDHQTLMGKTPVGVLKRAQLQGIPVVAIGGQVRPDAHSALMGAGFKAIFPIVREPITLVEAMRPDVAAANVERAMYEVIKSRFIVEKGECFFDDRFY